jgi:phosphoenolpyruvate carboxykinase (ATP)
MPNARRSEFSNWNVQTEVDSRSAACTYIVTDDADSTWGPAISVEEGVRLSRLQDDYIAEREMLVIDGYIGNDPEFHTGTRLMIEKENANIAGMQKILYYEADDGGEGFEPELTVTTGSETRGSASCWT